MSQKEFRRRNLEAALRLAQSTMENSLRLIAIQNELTQELLRDNLEYAQTLAQAKTSEEALRIRNEYAQAVGEKILAAAQKIAELGNAARSEFAQLLAEQLAAGSQEMADALQGFLAHLPGQGQGIFEAMEKAMVNANRTFEQMTQAAAAAFSAGASEKSAGKNPSR